MDNQSCRRFRSFVLREQNRYRRMVLVVHCRNIRPVKTRGVNNTSVVSTHYSMGVRTFFIYINLRQFVISLPYIYPRPVAVLSDSYQVLFQLVVECPFINNNDLYRVSAFRSRTIRSKLIAVSSDYPFFNPNQEIKCSPALLVITYQTIQRSYSSLGPFSQGFHYVGQTRRGYVPPG